MGHVLPSAGSKATYSIALGGSRNVSTGLIHPDADLCTVILTL